MKGVDKRGLMKGGGLREGVRVSGWRCVGGGGGG